MTAATAPPHGRTLSRAALAGAAVGILGGLIGLGGAEFRLPLLIGIFGFAALQAVILNKAMSLIVVATALPARLLGVPFEDVADEWTVIVNLLVGSLLGAWLGATWATRESFVGEAPMYYAASLMIFPEERGGRTAAPGSKLKTVSRPPTTYRKRS